MKFLRQVSPSDALSQLAVKGFLETAPAFADVPFIAKKGATTEVKQARTGVTQTAITRALNASANDSTPPTPDYEYPVKKIVSFDSPVDVTLEDRNEDPQTELATQTYLDAREAGYAAQSLFFKGDTTKVATNPNGLDKLCSNVVKDGVDIPVGGDAQTAAMQIAVERFNKYINIVKRHGGVSAVYMPEDFLARWVTIGKKLGYYRTQKDDLGNELDNWQGVPLKSCGVDASDTSIITPVSGKYPFYFVRYGEKVDVFAITSVGMKTRYSGQQGNLIYTNTNMDFNLHVQNTRALYKVTGWGLGGI